MFKQVSQSEYEMEKMIKDRRHDLQNNNFATLSGIQGNQFGREIFSSVIKFKDLMEFMKVFPEVQRDVSNVKVRKIKTYILSGLEDNSLMRFFSAVTVTCRGHLFYSNDTQKVAIDTVNSKLSINDGQHRYFGISEAIRHLEGKVNTAKTPEDRNDYYTKLEELKEMVIPIVIFNQISEREEKQLFTDLNNLAQRPSRNATIKLAQTDIYSKLARELADNNVYLKKYGVEMDKASIQASNPNTILLTTVYAFIKQLFWLDYKANAEFINKDNYAEYKEIVDTTLNNVFLSLPSDVDTKGKYMIDKSYTLKAIAKFLHDCKVLYSVDENTAYNVIRKTNWSVDVDNWKAYGPNISRRGKVTFTTTGGLVAVYDKLMGVLNENRRDLFTEIESERETETNAG
jgi:DNA sulfur modification protein DndB